jgi:CSLREA domain-containing protein
MKLARQGDGVSRNSMPRSLAFWTLSALSVLILLICWPASVVSAATFTVNSQDDLADAAPGDGNCISTGPGVCTLRAAIMEANALAGADTIEVPAGLYVLTKSGNDANNGSAGDLDISSDVTIVGAGARTTIIDGDGALSEDRVFDIGPLGAANVSISGVTIRNGHAGGATGPDSENGGGIQQISGTFLTLTDVIVTGNDTAFFGGGIYTEGDITIVRSLISGNVNSDPGSGGDGGGIALNGGQNKIINTTFSGNSADDRGGAISATFGFTLIAHSTFSGNSAPGGGAAISQVAPASVSSRANIFAASGTANCLGSSIPSLGSNLSGDASCGGHATDATNVSNLNLGPLANNGGPTNTFALLVNSAAIDVDQGNCTETGGGGTQVSVDQRGVSRPKDGNGDGTPVCDAGAYEAPASGRLQFSAATYSVVENAGTATITVTRTGGSDGAVGATVSLSNGTATTPADYDATARTISFADGDATPKTVSVPIVNDVLDEPDETVNLTLGSPTGGTSIGSPAAAVLTIQDDDAPPTLSISDTPAVTEGNTGSVNATFTVTLGAATTFTVTVVVRTADGTAIAGSDYTATGPTTLTFSPGGALTQTFAVPVLGDTVDEPNETFLVNLTDAANATIADSQGVGTINDDDGAPALSIAGVSRAEGNSGASGFAFTVSLLPASAQQVTVQAQTADGTATAGSDYAAIGLTTLTFTPGTTEQLFTVAVIGDTMAEPDETFLVTLTGPVNAILLTSQATGTIVNDDSAPTLAVDDVSLPEGNSVVTAFPFTVRLTGVTDQTVTVVAQTADGSAAAGSDYTALGPITLTFPPGATTQTVTVSVIGDQTVESDESFTVNLSSATNATISDSLGLGTIRNDDGSGPPLGVVVSGGTTEKSEKEDSPAKPTEEQQQQQQLTNTSNKDDVHVEGNVVEVHTDELLPYVVIANRDGLVRVNLFRDATKAAGSIRVGDYLDASGEKQHEQLFDAYDVSIKRAR